VGSGGVTVRSGEALLLDGARVEAGLRVGGGIGVVGGLEVQSVVGEQPIATLAASSVDGSEGVMLSATTDGEPVMQLGSSGKLTLYSGGMEVRVARA
jgi:hypothetical protein